jgi:hypothetical protein
MYLVSTQSARTSFFLLLAWACGCSGVAETTHTIRIAPEVLSAGAACEAFDGGASAPNSIIQCQSSAGPLFATLLEDCSIPEKFTFQATTRQLMVGMTGLQIVSQTPVAVAGTNVLHTVVRGSIDAEPVVLSTFTKRRGGCISDLVLWKATPRADVSPDEVSTFTAASRELATLLVPPTLTSVEDTDDQD